MTNSEFARKDEAFKTACKRASQKVCRDYGTEDCHGDAQCLSCSKATILDTSRQASKFRRGKGAAYKGMLGN